jgi:hypothetical protein
MDHSDIFIKAIPPPEGVYFDIVDRSSLTECTAERTEISIPITSDDLSLEAIPAKREDTRRHLAILLLALISTISIAILIGVLSHSISVAEAKEISGAILPPLTSILAIMIGFLFGEQKLK